MKINRTIRRLQSSVRNDLHQIHIESISKSKACCSYMYILGDKHYQPVNPSPGRISWPLPSSLTIVRFVRRMRDTTGRGRSYLASFS